MLPRRDQGKDTVHGIYAQGFRLLAVGDDVPALLEFLHRIGTYVPHFLLFAEVFPVAEFHHGVVQHRLHDGDEVFLPRGDVLDGHAAGETFLPEGKEVVDRESIDEPVDGLALVHGALPRVNIITVGAPVAGDLDAEDLGDRLPVVVERAPGIVRPAVAGGPAVGDLGQRQAAGACVNEGLHQPDVFVNEFGNHGNVLSFGKSTEKAGESQVSI